MNNLADPNSHIREYLRDYLGLTRAPGYAVMIRGAWGIGKTFLIRDILAEQFPEGDGHIYVSLYGVSSPEEIDSSIFAATHPLLGSRAAKVVGRAINAGLKFKGIENPLTLQDFTSRTSRAIYIFDDIERSSMTSDAIFGYLNQFVEHAGCRVILVANEAELEKTPGYRSKREKLVGQTLEAKSVARGALTAFLAEMSDASARNYLGSCQEQVVALYDQGEVSNLRVLKQTIWDFERFYCATEEKHRQNGDAMLHILQQLFALSFEIKLGRLEASDLHDRMNRWLGSAMRGGEPSVFKDACDRYRSVDLHDTTLSDELLEELLARGVVDEKMIRRDLNASSWFVDVGQEASWRTIWHWFDRSDEEIHAAITTLTSELAAHRYTEPGEILHTFGVMLKLSDISLIPDDRDAVLAQAKAYIETLRANAQLPLLKSDSFMEDIRHGAWGSLGFTENGTPHFRELRAFLEDQRRAAVADRLPGLAENLLHDLETDIGLFCSRLVGDGPDVIDGPVLAQIDPAVFLAAVQKQPAPAQFRAFRCLKSRHGSGDLMRELPAERPWVETLRNLMISQTETASPLQKYKLTEFAKLVGESLGENEGDPNGANKDIHEEAAR